MLNPNHAMPNAAQVARFALLLVLAVLGACAPRSTNVRTIPDSGGRTWTGTAHISDTGRVHDAIGFDRQEVVKSTDPIATRSPTSDGKPLYPGAYVIAAMAQEASQAGRQTWLHAHPLRSSDGSMVELFSSDVSFDSFKRRPLAPGSALLIDGESYTPAGICDLAGVEDDGGGPPYVGFTACNGPSQCVFVLAQVDPVSAGWRPSPTLRIRVEPRRSFLLSSCMTVATTGTGDFDKHFVAVGVDSGEVFIYRAGELSAPALHLPLTIRTGFKLTDVALLRDTDASFNLVVFWRSFDDGPGRVQMYRIDVGSRGSLMFTPAPVVDEPTPEGSVFMETPGNISRTSTRELHYFTPTGIVVVEYNLRP